METTLSVYLDDQWQVLDLYETAEVSVVLQALDITNLEQRKSNYTKTFTIPATSNNSIIFEHYFEVNGIDFNPLTKIDAVIQHRGTDIFNGILRLQSVIVSPTKTEFEVYIMGEVGDFSSEVQNLQLRDLDYTDLLHENSYDNVVLSWEAKDNDTDGLFGGKIVYPLINYGLAYQDTGTGATPQFTYTFGETRSFDQAGYAVPPEFFKPAIRIRDVIDRIFSATSYTLNSEFMDTDYFKSIYMDTFQNGKLGIESASAVTNQNIFRVYQRPYSYFDFQNTDPSGFARRVDFETFNPDGYDPLTNFKLGPPTPGGVIPQSFFVNPNGFSYFRVPYAGDYSWNYRFNFDGGGIIGSNIFFQMVAYKGATEATATAFAATASYSTLAAPTDFAVNWFFTGACLAGDYVFIKLEINGGTQGSALRIKPYSDAGIQTSAPQWDLYSAPTLQGQQLVDMKLGIADLNALSFLKGITTMFNLVVIQDVVNKQINFTPFPWYYNETDRQERDWTQKLDLNSSYKIEPLSFDLSKEINFTYEPGSEEYLNKLFEDDKSYVYGRYRYVSTSNLLTDESQYQVPFAAFPTTVVNGSDNVIIGAVYRELNNQLQPYSNKPHIFFWAGNRWTTTDALKFIPVDWYLASGATPVAQSTYPCVSHLSSLDVQIPTLVSDLNFGSTFDFFGNYNTQPVQFSPYDLYHTFWTDYIDDSYSNETRRLTGRFYMKPMDLYEVKLTDKIYVKDSFYRIEKINDGDLVSPKLTEISLIKERGGYNKIIPPAPFYPLSGNTPFPGLASAYTETVFSGFSQADVCNGTAPTGDILTFGVSGLTNYQVCYYDTGVSYNLLQRGTYLRSTGQTETYVVIDNQGRILEQEC